MRKLINSIDLLWYVVISSQSYVSWWYILFCSAQVNWRPPVLRFHIDLTSILTSISSSSMSTCILLNFVVRWSLYCTCHKQDTLKGLFFAVFVVNLIKFRNATMRQNSRTESRHMLMVQFVKIKMLRSSVWNTTNFSTLWCVHVSATAIIWTPLATGLIMTYRISEIDIWVSTFLTWIMIPSL